MSQPDYQHGYLRIPLAVWLGVFCGRLLTRRQLQLVAVVIRHSWGWRTGSGEVQNWTRPLTSRDFAQVTGLSTDHLQRDLNDLRARGVVRKEGKRYQFVADFRVWITSPQRAPKVRQAAPGFPASSAKAALFPSSRKKRKKEKDSSAWASRGRLSPGEDNSSSFVAPRRVGRLRHCGPLVDRFVTLVAAFTGPLSVWQSAVLRRRLQATSLAAVWQALEPEFRQGRKVAEQRLTVWLREPWE